MPRPRFDDLPAEDIISSSKKIAPNNAGNVRQPKNLKKEKKHSKGNLASKRIVTVFKTAVLAIIIIGSIGTLSFCFWDDAKNKDWIVRLEELESTQKSENGGVLNTYQLDGEFERMSVKAVNNRRIHCRSMAQSCCKSGLMIH